ncbi:hypothetical protein HS088_TW13G01026 [Tripterygium wilfordii]|uniref:C3H1-type domain-containing protein n=1 Tax=Tripterygium wilfordii TaxID=458696 RepID=A0A7J7CVN7_TRIWF|nr:zinc finger CCCH domain-containing protein 6-like [Tripterygium wilfordii]KAF5738131.1 hypothetical protein HS088_TW13G01026 [Tripterygium wilfordii]
MRLETNLSRKRNRASWAGGNPCQVKLFLAKDSHSDVSDERLQGQLKSSGMLCPPKVGAVLSHCHVRSSGLWRSNDMESQAHFPGSKGCPNVCDKPFRIPQIKWKCPPKFIMRHNWLVAAGEESLERDSQKLREMRLPEAVYPSLSHIPPSPSVSLDIEDQHYDDSLTPEVPLINEEEEAIVIPSDLVAPLNTSTADHLPAGPQHLSSSKTPNTLAFEPAANQKPTSGLLHDVGEKCSPKTLPACQKPSSELLRALDIPAPELLTDLITAAEAAVTAIVKSKEEGSMIDTDLLIKIFSDPIMIQQLMKENGASSGTDTPTLSSKPLTGLVSASYPKPEMVLSPMPATRSSHDVQVRPTVTRMSPQAQLRSITRMSPQSQLQPTVIRMSPQPQLRPTITRTSPQPQLRPVVTTMSPQPQLRPVVTRTSPQPQLQQTVTMMSQPQLQPTVTMMSPQPQLRPTVTRMSPQPQLQPMVTRMSPQPQLQPVVTMMSPQPQLRPMVTRMSPQPQLRPTVTMMSPQPQLRPTVTWTSPQLGYMPVSGVDFGVKQVAPSVPLVGPEPSRVLPPYPLVGMEIGNMFLKPNGMEANLPAMSVQTGSFPVTSFTAMNPSSLHRSPVQSNGFPVPSFVGMQNNQVKNKDYIKSLIREHGVQQEEPQVGHIPPYTASHHNLEREFKPKIQKPCIFFKSSRGCRNGVSCQFLHETCSSTLEAPNPKRMKLGLGGNVKS